MHTQSLLHERKSKMSAKINEIRNEASLRERVQDLIQKVESGKAMEAFETYYADDIAMQENGNTPTVGKAVNRVREEQFFGSIAEVHEGRAVSYVADGDHAAIHWVMEFTTTGGQRARLDQIAYQTWKNGQIVHERFFYTSAAE
jgi:hypothetical protein